MSELLERMTQGVMNAVAKSPQHSVCGCGFPLPRYPGRYPKNCPNCGEERVPPADPVTQSEDDEGDGE